MIRNAHVNGHIAVIVADPGMGKTVTCEHYEKQYSNVALIKTAVGHNANALLELICKKLGIPSRGVISKMLEDIIEHLRGSNQLLIIDEAENLPLKALEAIRAIHDQSGAGVVLAGTQRLIISLRGSRGELAQLYSRVWQYENLGNKLPESDLTEIIATTTDDSDVVSECLRACEGNGRMLDKLLSQSQRISQLNNMPITVEIVRDAEKMLLKK